PARKPGWSRSPSPTLASPTGRSWPAGRWALSTRACRLTRRSGFGYPATTWWAWWTARGRCSPPTWPGRSRSTPASATCCACANWHERACSGQTAPVIPIRDDNPVRHFPIVTISIIALNVLAFLLWQPTFGSESDQQTFFFCHVDIPWEVTHQTSLGQGGPEAQQEIARQLGESGSN